MSNLPFFLELPNYNLTQIRYRDSDSEIDYGSEIVVNEPEWMRKERIKRTLPFLCEAILDESREVDFGFESKLSKTPLSLYGQCGVGYVGRKYDIITLGEMKFKPAYNSLREVWLHDSNENLRRTAFDVLGNLGDERIIGEVRKKVLEETEVDDFQRYIKLLQEYPTQESVQTLDIITDLCLYMNQGVPLTPEERHYEREDAIYGGIMQFELSDLLMAYHKLIEIPGSVQSVERIMRTRTKKPYTMIDRWNEHAKDIYAKQTRSSSPQLFFPNGYVPPQNRELFGVQKIIETDEIPF